MEAWKKVWREGIAPQLSDAGLQALATAIETDDPRLLQGVTTSPPSLQSMQDNAVNGACATAFCGWQGDGLATVGEVEDFFARICWETDRRIGEPQAVRKFLEWFDDTPRIVMRHNLLDEVKRSVRQRSLSEAR